MSPEPSGDLSDVFAALVNKWQIMKVTFCSTLWQCAAKKYNLL